MIQGSQMGVKMLIVLVKDLEYNYGAFGRGNWVACLWVNGECRKGMCLVRETVRFLMFVCLYIVV